MSQASTSMARMWPSKRAKKAGLASNSFMSSAARRRARKSSSNWACPGGTAGQPWKPGPRSSPGAPNSDPCCRGCGLRDGGARALARGGGTREAKKGRAGKTLRAQCFKTLGVDGDAGPGEEGDRLWREGTWNMANAGPASPGPWASAGLLQLRPRPLPGKGRRQTQPSTRVPLGQCGQSSCWQWSPPLHQGPPHILGSILARLLRGQLSNQQGLQELAHEIEVLVEGVEGILKESRQSGGQKDRQLQ